MSEQYGWWQIQQHKLVMNNSNLCAYMYNTDKIMAQCLSCKLTCDELYIPTEAWVQQCSSLSMFTSQKKNLEVTWLVISELQAKNGEIMNMQIRMDYS